MVPYRPVQNNENTCSLGNKLKMSSQDRKGSKNCGFTHYVSGMFWKPDTSAMYRNWAVCDRSTVLKYTLEDNKNIFRASYTIR